MSATGSPSRGSDKKVCYYELLNVEKSATPDQIRKAYLRASLKYHPDKNPGNPEAEEIFKEVSEAYAVLSDESRRERYDKFGFEAAKEMNIDPEEMFEQMFGTRDPVEAFKKIMSDPELRGPVILGTGLAATVAGVATTIHGIREKKGGSAALHAVGGLAGTLGGLTLAVGGAATWLVDAGIQGTKKGVRVAGKYVDEKIDDFKEELEKKRQADLAARRAAQSGLNYTTEIDGCKPSTGPCRVGSPCKPPTDMSSEKKSEGDHNANDRLYPNLEK